MIVDGALPVALSSQARDFLLRWRMYSTLRSISSTTTSSSATTVAERG